jgi:hypothetical protein
LFCACEFSDWWTASSRKQRKKKQANALSHEDTLQPRMLSNEMVRIIWTCLRKALNESFHPIIWKPSSREANELKHHTTG